MHRMRRANTLFRFEPGESRLVALLFVEYFFIGVTSVFTQSAVFALFLAEFGSEGLPYSYVSSAIGASALAFLYLKLTERFSLSTSLIINLGGLALVSILINFGLGLPDHHWLVFVLPVWFQVIANLSALAVWTLAARLFDVRQGKRLFGLIGAGNWFAVAAGGFIVAPLVAWIGTPNLFLLAGLALVIASACQFILLRQNRARLTTPPPAPAQPRGASVTRGLLQNRYLLSILLAVSLVWVAFFFIDNIFYDAAATQITDVNQLASFIGTLNVAIGIIGLLMTVLLTGPVLRRFGVGNSLLILPGILTVSMLLLAVTGMLTTVGLFIFALAAFSKIIDVALTFTLDLSSRTILYQALPPQQRVRIQTIADGIVQPISIGIAGILLLIFNTWLSFTAVQLALLFVFIGAAWLLVVFAVRHQYPLAVAQALAKRHLGENPSPLTEPISISLLRESLSSPQPGTVLYAANLLAAQEPSTLALELPNLLAHPSPQVRRDALERIERAHLTGNVPAVFQRISAEPSSELRGLAVETYARLGTVAERQQAETWLTDPSPFIRNGAITGLLEASASTSAPAHHALQSLANSPDVQERIAATEILAQVHIPERESLLLSLLRDTDTNVQKAALRAIATMHFPDAMPLAATFLAVPTLRRATINALAAAGSYTLPLLEKTFAANPTDPQVQFSLAQVCCKIGTQEAVALLCNWMQTPYTSPRTEILSSLSRLHYRASSSDASKIHVQIRTELAQIVSWCAVSADLGTDPVVDLTQHALAAEIAAARDRVFFLLSFLYDPRAILNARANLTESTAEKRAYALEVLDILLPHDLKTFVLPLAEHSTPAQYLAALSGAFPQQHTDRADRLRALINISDPAYDSWLRETARYAAHRLNLSGLDPGKQGDSTVFSTIEKVIILKGVDLFAETPDDVLRDVAEVCQELDVAAGETIFHKGDAGDSLYVIVSGHVRVHDSTVTLNELGQAEVFGEMALLDPEPRLASVTALQDTSLLRLAQGPFQELLEEQSAIARSIIRVLTRRLRARVRDLTQAGAVQVG